MLEALKTISGNLIQGCLTNNIQAMGEQNFEEMYPQLVNTMRL